MEKWLCWGSLGVSGVLLLLFLLDFVLGLAGVTFLPFGGISYVIDIICILVSSLILYLSWDTLSELR